MLSTTLLAVSLFLPPPAGAVAVSSESPAPAAAQATLRPRSIATRLEELHLLDLESSSSDNHPDIATDPLLATLQVQLAQLMNERKRLGITFGDRNERMVQNQTLINELRENILARKRLLVAVAKRKYEDMLGDTRLGCDAIGIATSGAPAMPVLKPADASPTGSAFRVLDADVWLVHRLPSGAERSQLQSLRIRDGGVSEFFFKPLTIAARRTSVVLDVFGAISAMVLTDGQTHLTVTISRQPQAKAAGSATPGPSCAAYTVSAATGVLSFDLPPAVGDDAALVGHRLSVRVRIAPQK